MPKRVVSALISGARTVFSSNSIASFDSLIGSATPIREVSARMAVLNLPASAVATRARSAGIGICTGVRPVIFPSRSITSLVVVVSSPASTSVSPATSSCPMASAIAPPASSNQIGWNR